MAPPQVKTFFSPSLGILLPSKPLQLLDYLRCNAMTPENTEIPKQCHALCDRENIHLFNKPALFWEFWEHWPKSGNFLQCHTGIIGEYTGTAFIFNKYYLRNEDRRWSNRRLSLQQCDPIDEMNGKSSYPTMWWQDWWKG